VLLPSDADDIPTSWSRDGQSILFTRYGKTRAGVWLMPLSGDSQPKPIFQSEAFDQGAATFSPNGRLIAYTSNESGRWEVYVQSFPASADKLMVSSTGGFMPLWRNDGKELFYLTDDGRVMSAEIKSGAKLESSVPLQLFQTRIKFADDYPYAINPDGSRFLINIPAETNDTAPMIVVLNWTAALKKQ
jgi:Tol biopolymer transport system component